MNANLMDDLVVLQDRELRKSRSPSEGDSAARKLRGRIPESVLLHFDRWLARGRKAVAVVHNGVCGECHIHLPIGVVAALASGQEFQQCSNCGRYLDLAKDPSVTAPPAKADRKRVASHAH